MVVTSTKLVLASSQLLIPVLDDFHFRVLAFLQGLSTCFHLNLALLTQKIQITIRTMGVEWICKLFSLKCPMCTPTEFTKPIYYVGIFSTLHNELKREKNSNFKCVFGCCMITDYLKC